MGMELKEYVAKLEQQGKELQDKYKTVKTEEERDTLGKQFNDIKEKLEAAKKKLFTEPPKLEPQQPESPAAIAKQAPKPKKKTDPEYLEFLGFKTVKGLREKFDNDKEVLDVLLKATKIVREDMKRK